MPETPSGVAPADGGEIVVTGSLIRNPNLERSSPVTTIGSDHIELKASNTAEELLREIPGIVPGIGSTVSLGNFGASYVSLRGLGENRNLILVNGTRLVPAEVQGRFDLNNIPLALIERTDVLTGGASTTYGADAVSGVINFVTRSRFTGIELSASQQITEEGDGNVFRADLIAGQEFGDGRGSIVVAGGYQNSNPVYQGDREFSRISFDSTTGQPSGSPITVPTAFSLPGLGSQQMRPDGSLAPLFAPYNTNPPSILQTGFERYNLFGTARYAFTDSLEVYGRAIWSRNTVDTINAPGGAFNAPVQINLNNPYLPAAARNQFCVANGINAGDCLAAASATGPGDPAYLTVNSVMSRRSTEYGPRTQSSVTTFQDYQLGFKGAITSSIEWDVFGSYGESRTISSGAGAYRNSRMRQSMLAVRDGANIVCIDPSNGCVPVDWFGQEGSITTAMSDFLGTTTEIRQDVSLAQVNGRISGDVGWAMPLTGTPVSFAVGGEYRSYEARQTTDALTRTGDIGGGGPIPNVDGAYDVWEVFGELVLPIAQDKPFLQDLTFEAGVRHSNYSVDAPNSPSFQTTTWKVGGSWAPIGSIKFRGNYARAVRAPNIAELFEPQNTMPGALLDDPCASLTSGGASVGRPAPTGALRDTCIAQGAPANQIGFIQQPALGQAYVTTGGNLDLRPEKSTSWTVGVVLTPEFLPRFNMTIDYYNIRVTDAITIPTTGDIINACFNSPSPSNPACLLIERDQITGTLNGDPTRYRGITLARSNLGRLATDGIDLTASYRTDLGFAQWLLTATGNWANKSTFQATASSINRDCLGIYGVNCTSIQPEFLWSVRNTLTFRGGIDVSLLWRHIDGVRSEARLFSGNIPLLGGSYDFNRIPSYDYFDFSTRVPVGDSFTFLFSIQNLFDKQPPIVGNTLRGNGFNSGNTYPATYDALGRRFAFTAKMNF